MKLPSIDVIKMPEIWLEVFSYLPHGDLLTSTEVCTCWNEMISGSQIFTSKTILRIEGKPAMATFKITRSCYESLILILLWNGSSENRQLLTQLIQTADRLRYVYFYGEFFGVDVINFLNHCSQLKKLKIRGHIVRSYDVISTVKLDLDELYARMNDKWILNHLECRSVRNEINISLAALVNENSDEIVSFLNKVEGEVGYLKIKEIDLDKTAVEFVPKFKWRTLYIVASNSDTMFAQAMPNKQKLYDSAFPNAKMILDWFNKGNLQVFNVIANTTNVTSLLMNTDLFVGIITQDQADALPNIEHIEHLSIQTQGKPTTSLDLSLYLEPFLNKLTQLNSLAMDAALLKSLSTERFQPYHLNLKSLHLWTHITDLFIDEVTSEFLQQFVLPKVETLEITDLLLDVMLSDEFDQILTTFGQNNPSLKKLTITPYYHPDFVLSDAELQKILLYAFAAMPSVHVFEVEYGDLKLYRGTRKEINEKYFGSDMATCATLKILR